jgi:hypothetical protein
MGEIHRSWSKHAFTRALQKLLPALTVDDIQPAARAFAPRRWTAPGNSWTTFILFLKIEFCMFAMCRPRRLQRPW